MAALAKQLDSMNDEQLEDLAAEEDEGPKDSRQPAKKGSGDASDSDDDDESGEKEFDAGAMAHDAYFSESKGGAKIKKDDENFDVEMGGASQAAFAATMLACEDMRDDDDDSVKDDPEEEIEEEDDDAPTPRDYVPPVVKNTKGASEAGKSRESTNPAPPAADNEAAEEDDDDDKTVGLEGAEPAESSKRLQPSKADDEVNGTNKTGNAESSEDMSSPDRSTCSQDGLRTQPTQTPKPRAKKKAAASKVSIMGSVFETKKKGTQPGKKKSSGLYIPSYKK